MDNIEWYDILNYEGLYQISKCGKVKSLRNEIILKPNLTTSGYENINLWKDKKPSNKMIHQLMAIAFLNHKPDGQNKVVDHIDNNKTNNDISNLQVITQRLNSIKDKKKPKSGYHGVYYSTQNKKWQVRPRINGIKTHLGYFDTPEEASNFYNYILTLDLKKYTVDQIKDLKKFYKDLLKQLKN